MKRGRNSHTYPDQLPDHNFSRGIRGKYAAGDREPAAAVNIHTWAPLVGFRWSGLERRVAEDTWIRQGSTYRGYEHKELADFLAKEEKDVCRGTRHWLHLIRPAQQALSSRAAINTFLLALWIVRPTRTQVPFRFEEVESSRRTVARVLDRFQWIESQTAEDVEDQDLLEVSHILPPLRDSYLAGRRLKNGLVLTFRGCVSVDWQSAFICHAAAAESLLTYKRAPGVTERLAIAYAKLVAGSPASVEPTAAQFKHLYSVRSDIVHGRAHDRSDPVRNLNDLAAFSDVVRHLWKVILNSEEYRTALDQSDEERESLFLRL